MPSLHFGVFHEMSYRRQFTHITAGVTNSPDTLVVLLHFNVRILAISLMVLGNWHSFTSFSVKDSFGADVRVLVAGYTHTHSTSGGVEKS